MKILKKADLALIVILTSAAALSAKPPGGTIPRNSIPVFSSMNECAGAGSYLPTDSELIIANPTPEYIVPFGDYPNSIAPAYPIVSAMDWIYNPPEDRIPEELKRSLRGEALQPTPAQLEQQRYNASPPADPCRDSDAVAPAKRAEKSGESAFLDRIFSAIKEDLKSAGFAFTEQENEITGEGLSFKKLTKSGPNGPVTAALVFIIDGNVSFATGSALLTPAAEQIIAKIGRAMQRFAEMEAAIGGHTDSKGSLAGNERLSQQRAQSVADALISRHSIAASRIREVKGFADTRKVVDTNESEPRNRRVEVVLTPARRSI